jgi:glycosyltransferase involved in cell wall biosynthesis
MRKMKIVYYSVTRYPTEKAYGVTIKYTFMALKSMGHQVEIISPEYLYKKQSKFRIERILLFIAKNLETTQRFLEANRNSIFTAFTTKAIFFLKVSIFSFVSKYSTLKEIDILWVRQPLLCVLAYKRKNIKNIVIEIHTRLKPLSKISLKFIEKSKKLVMAPISIELRTELYNSRLNFDKSKIVFSPMGVPDSFFIDKIYRKNFRNSVFNLGYVGNMRSSGYDQKIRELILCIEKLNNENLLFKIRIYLYGIEKNYLPLIRSDFERLIKHKLLVVTPRIPHKDLVPKLRKCDAFILPYPEGDYFKNRFPLKALEYAALYRPIVVTDTVSHRNIFKSNEVWFYEFGDCRKILECIIGIQNNYKFTVEKLDRAYFKSSQHTYHHRVKNILNALSS